MPTCLSQRWWKAVMWKNGRFPSAAGIGIDHGETLVSLYPRKTSGEEKPVRQTCSLGNPMSFSGTHRPCSMPRGLDGLASPRPTLATHPAGNLAHREAHDAGKGLIRIETRASRQRGPAGQHGQGDTGDRGAGLGTLLGGKSKMSSHCSICSPPPLASQVSPTGFVELGKEAIA